MSRTSTNTSSVSLALPLERLSTLPEGEPALTLGYGVAEWCQTWLVQPNGPRAGQPFRLTFNQFRFLLWWYAIDAKGGWVFHHGVRRLAKGSGKSPFAAVLALAEFLGPVRLDHFDDRVPGGAVGKPVELPLVQIAAVSEAQTRNTMRMVRAYAPKGSKVVEAYDVDVGKVQYFKLPEGTLEVITSSFTSTEGAESSFVIADETEHWLPGNGGPELQSTLQDNLAKSGERMLETCNAWESGQESAAEAAWDAWVAQEEGRLQDQAGSTLYDAVLAPPDTDMADYGSLESALRRVYADCDWKRGPDGEIDVAPLIARIWDPKADPEDSQRKYLNWPAAHGKAWVTPESVQLLVDRGRVVEDGEPIVMFFDGSKSRDATGLMGCCISDGHVFRIGGWEPDPGDPDDVVPVAEVDETVKGAAYRWDVWAFWADVREWESFTKVSWPEYFEQLPKSKRLLLPAEKGKHPELIAWDMRSKSMDFTRATELTLEEINSTGFTFDGDAMTARHLVNARRRATRWGTTIGKASKDSPAKIDLAVTLIGARMLRYAVLAAGVKRRAASSGKVVVMS